MIPSPGNLPYDLRDTTLEDIEPRWRKEFQSEVEDGNFLRGGKSVMLVGEGACQAARQWLACLIRANFKAYRITPFEIVRRMSGLSVVWDTDTRKTMFEEAECFLVDDFFFDHDDGITGEDAYLIWMFLQEALRDGAVIILASDSEKIGSINYCPDYVWELVENSLEVIRVNKPEAQTNRNGIQKRKKADR